MAFHNLFLDAAVWPYYLGWGILAVIGAATFAAVVFAVVLITKAFRKNSAGNAKEFAGDDAVSDDSNDGKDDNNGEKN